LTCQMSPLFRQRFPFSAIQQRHCTPCQDDRPDSKCQQKSLWNQATQALYLSHTLSAAPKVALRICHESRCLMAPVQASAVGACAGEALATPAPPAMSDPSRAVSKGRSARRRERRAEGRSGRERFFQIVPVWARILCHPGAGRRGLGRGRVGLSAADRRPAPVAGRPGGRAVFGGGRVTV
jgi:hypothetical protein